MPYAQNGDVSLYYESHGPEGGIPLCLVKGFGSQMITWQQGFVALLTAAGIRVTMFDNRDVGLSTMTGGPDDHESTYTMFDMAADAASVMTAAGHREFHVAGSSMGGMIAQRMLVQSRDRIRSATLIYTSSNIRRDSKAAPGGVIMSAEMSRDEYVAAQLVAKKNTMSSRFPTPDHVYDEESRAAYDRSFRPDGGSRQRGAVIRTKDVEEELRQVSVPVAIMHGREDSLIDVSAAFRLAELIPGSDLHVLDGWNHEIPEQMWPTVTSVIIDTVRRGEQASGR